MEEMREPISITPLFVRNGFFPIVMRSMNEITFVVKENTESQSLQGDANVKKIA